QEHAARLKDGSHAHGDGLARHVLLTEEVAGGVNARDVVECDQTGDGVLLGTGLVEADVSRAANPQNLDVDPAHIHDLLLIFSTVIVHLVAGNGAVGNVDVRRIDVNVVE